MCVCTDYLLIIFVNEKKITITILDRILQNHIHHSAQSMFSQEVKKQSKRWAHLLSPNLSEKFSANFIRFQNDYRDVTF